jgi:hypothetical protein
MSPTSTTGTSAAMGEAHIGDVVGAQVGLGRAARALDEHQVALGFQPTEALDDGGEQRPPCVPGSPGL